MRTTTSSRLTAMGSVLRWRQGTLMESVDALMLWMAMVAGSPMRRCMTCSSNPICEQHVMGHERVMLCVRKKERNETDVGEVALARAQVEVELLLVVVLEKEPQVC